MSGNNIPGANVPLVGQDGRLSPAWFQFFLTLFARTGGTGDMTEAEAGALTRNRLGTDEQAQDVAPRRARRERKPDEVVPTRHALPRLLLTKESYKPYTMIRLYTGAAGDIPTGWQLADGTNGTPNMHDLFVVGAGNLYLQGSAGGSTTITADNLPAHTHPYNDSDTTYTATSTNIQPGTGAAVSVVTGITPGGGINPSTSGSNATTTQPYLPPYYAVAYIINTKTVTVVTDAKLR